MESNTHTHTLISGKPTRNGASQQTAVVSQCVSRRPSLSFLTELCLTHRIVLSANQTLFVRHSWIANLPSVSASALCSRQLKGYH